MNQIQQNLDDIIVIQLDNPDHAVKFLERKLMPRVMIIKKSYLSPLLDIDLKILYQNKDKNDIAICLSIRTSEGNTSFNCIVTIPTDESKIKTIIEKLKY